jgi:transposase
MDLGDKYSQLCVLAGNGEVVEETRIRTTREGVDLYFQGRTAMRVVLEVGTHSRWVSERIARAGHQVIVANARRVRLIAENNRKSDQVDAELLARLGRVDPSLLAPIKHRGQERQQDLMVIRARAALVSARTKLVNSVRGQVKSAGHRVPSCSTARFAKLGAALPKELSAALRPLMESIGHLTEQIKCYDAKIRKLSEARVEIEPLQQIAGVGPLVALTYVSTLEDPARFRSARSVGPFLGLTSKKRQSGDSDPHLRISKKGDRYLRSLLVQSAHYILARGPDSELKRWGLAMAERGGKNGKKRAVIAVARKLSVLMYRLWVTGADYNPFPHAEQKQAA